VDLAEVAGLLITLTPAQAVVVAIAVDKAEAGVVNNREAAEVAIILVSASQIYPGLERVTGRLFSHLYPGNLPLITPEVITHGQYLQV
jgi:hypothetical protein